MIRDKDYDPENDDRPRRPPRLEIRYTFAVNGGPAPDKVHGERFQIGTTVSTSSGPHYVVEVFWRSADRARVLLRPISVEKKPENKPEKKPEKKSEKKSAPPPPVKPRKRFPRKPR